MLLLKEFVSHGLLIRDIELIEYDPNGNMTKMPDKGISGISYNFLNLPEQISQTNVSTFYYRADGVKLRKKLVINNAAGSNTINTEYLDGFVYTTRAIEALRTALDERDAATVDAKYARQEETFTEPDARVADPGGPLDATLGLSYFPTSEGYYDYENSRYIYQYKDHLGNVRVSYYKDDNTNTLEVADRNDFYPFGMNFVGYYSVFDAQGSLFNYKYNGKELQETGMYDYGARMYMPDVGRWGVVDPLAETSRRWSTYNYAYNNPMRFVDPDGMQNEDKIKIFNNGTIERTKDDNAYDTITNEDGSASIQIARTNVSESNPTGDSQIGEATTLNINTPGQGAETGSSEYTFLQIQNDDVAKQFFEFAAENTGVEFTRDTFSFSDGFSSNVIGTSHLANVSVSAYNMIGSRNLTGGNGFHIIGDATSAIYDHSHPMGQALAPGGFDSRFDKKTGNLSFNRIVTGSPFEDATFSANNPIYKSTNVYSTWKWPSPGKGYINYNNTTATYTGSIRK